MSPLALIARSGALLAVLALWLGVLGGGVLPVVRAGGVIVAPLCHAPDGRPKPALPAHLDDCDRCVLCTATGQPARAVVPPLPPPTARTEVVGAYRSFALPGREGVHRARGPPVALS